MTYNLHYGKLFKYILREAQKNDSIISYLLHRPEHLVFAFQWFYGLQ